MLILFITSLASYISIRSLISSADRVAHSNVRITKLEEIISRLKDAETGQRGYLLTGDREFLAPYSGAIQQALTLLDDFGREAQYQDIQQSNVQKLRKIIEGRLEVLEKTVDVKSRGGSVSVSALINGKASMDAAQKLIKMMESEEQRLLNLRTANMNKLSGYTPLLIIVAACLAILITIFFYRKVSSDFNARVKLQDELEVKTEEMDRRLAVIQEVANRISGGDYQVRLDEKQEDELGGLANSLNTMAKSLEFSFSLLADKEWLQSGIAALNDKMVGEKNLDTLTNDILEEVVLRTQSHVAAFYLVDEDKSLHLSAGYALMEDKKQRRLKFGEGLPGQAAQNGRLLLINEIPNGELSISYATGNTRPRNIVAIPIFKEQLIVGVMELGSLQHYTPQQLEYLNHIANNIGIAVYGAQNHRRLQEFLEETQAQAEELQAQHRELEELNAELEVQTQRIQTSEEELRVQQEELLQSNQELEERTSMLEEKNQLIQERNIDIQHKAEQLEQSTRYKSEFLANMSHELRTPLNSILLLSRLMSENKELDKEYTEYAEVIQSSGQGLLSLIDEILDLSKIEAGKMKLEFGKVRILEMTKDLRSLFAPIARNKQLELIFDIEPDLSSVNTDRMRLEQILKNLLSNAIKFTSSGKVSLTVRMDDAGKRILFKVTDTGIGIPASKQGLIFEAFQQADGSTRRMFGGTGLGLSISRELAKLLGGEIELTSKENVGSEFVLSMPVNPKPDSDPDQIAEVVAEEDQLNEPAVVRRYTVDHIPQEIDDDRAAILPGDRVILIIEDDTNFAKTLLKFTRDRNYKGIVAVRGDLGIALANHYQPLAILLDIQLPVKDGWQVMEELKSNPATRPIPVHIMSSMQAKKESLLKGAVDFIDKPVALEHMQRIFQTLEKALSKHAKKVLIIEENKQHADALSYFLSHYNLQTTVAKNVGESIAVLDKNEVDCLILDMGIPDKNAYDTLETIKKSPGLERLPIIVFTGKNLSKGEESRIKQYAESIVVKTAHSYQRILDEAAVFLHLVEEKEVDHSGIPASEKFVGFYEVLNDKTVLIADDDVRNIFSLTKALEQHKMKVLAATDGKEALQTLKEHPMVDIVLMDMMMPEMDGYETTKEIRKVLAYKQLPVLAVTAKAMMGDREKCIAAGASDYISKPVDIDQLISLLRVWLYNKA